MAKDTDQQGKSAGAAGSKKGGGSGSGSGASGKPAAQGKGTSRPRKSAPASASGPKAAGQDQSSGKAQNPSKVTPGKETPGKETPGKAKTASDPSRKADRPAEAESGPAPASGASAAKRTPETAATAGPGTTAAPASVASSNQTNRQDKQDMSNGTDDQTAQKIADYEQKKLQVNQQRRFEAERIVHQHAAVAAGVGVIPVPAIDIAGLAAVQLRMLAKLADKYDVKYSGNLARTLVSALLGVLVPLSLKATTYGFLRAVPVFGPLLGFLTLPGFAWAATYAIGTVFIDSFEQDEDLDNIDVDKAKQRVKDVFEKASAKANDQAAAATAKSA